MAVLDEWHVSIEVAHRASDAEAAVIGELVERELRHWARRIEAVAGVVVRVSR